MKKVVSVLLLATLALSMFAVGSSAVFGSGVEVVAREVTLIKTGLFGHKLTFSDADFKSAFCIDGFEKITVTKLPSSTEGTLLLAGRRIKEGQSIKRKNIAAMVFVPSSPDVKEAGFSFTLDGYAGGAEFLCQMKFIDKVNYAPEAPKEDAASLSMTTQSDISVYGKMNATDPENDEIEYIIVSYPKNGRLKITDDKAGKYKYTPSASFTGQDKFVYVARDCYGNYSEAVTVSIRTVERMSSQVYKDMADREEYNAAVAMSAMGIMSGRTLGDDCFFQPDENVTKAEFVAMAMKAYGIRPDSSLSKSFFDDNDDIPSSLLGYVATAQRAGIIDGTFTEKGLMFEPNRTITKYEAAGIMAELLGVSGEGEETVFLDIDTVPVWARQGVYAMYTLGIFDYDGDEVMGNKSVTRADAAQYLYRMISAA